MELRRDNAEMQKCKNGKIKVEIEKCNLEIEKWKV